MTVREMIIKYSMTLNNDGTVTARAKHFTSAEASAIKAAKPEIVVELKRMMAEAEEKKAAEEATRLQRIADIKAGAIKITVKYNDGEYLGGWEVFGEEAKLLEEIGLAKWVSGWGYEVQYEAVKALGESFTYAQAVEYMRPQHEAEKAEEEKKAQQKAELEKEKATMKVEILSRAKSDDGSTSAEVRITDRETGENLKFNCRNVFDFGYVINPLYEVAPGSNGGIDVDGKWQTNIGGKYVDIEMTEFEKKCVAYLSKFPPIYTGILM